MRQGDMSRKRERVSGSQPANPRILVGAKGFEPSTLWSQTNAMLSNLFQINDLRTPKLLEVAHGCPWMQIKLAQESRRPHCTVGMPEPQPTMPTQGCNTRSSQAASQLGGHREIRSLMTALRARNSASAVHERTTVCCGRRTFDPGCRS